MKKLLASVVLAVLSFAAFAQTAILHSQQNVSNKVRTYHATTVVSLAAAPNDFFKIGGSATATVYVREVRVNCVKTTAGLVSMTLAKRTTSTTGGTSATVTAAQHDSSSAAPTATISSWTVNAPTAGTGVSMITHYVPFNAPATIADNGPVRFSFGQFIDQYLVLRGVTQEMTLGLAGASMTGGLCAVSITWLEA